MNCNKTMKLIVIPDKEIKYIMAKYRAFIAANIYPLNKTYETNESFVIHIPEHILYGTKQEALESCTRWDYSFGFEDKNIVILIRHITVVDDDYGEIRDMPEFCYDYDTFIKLGGWIEHVIRDRNCVNIDRINKSFNCLHLLNDSETQIHINPIDMKILQCNETNIQIPIPINHIYQNSYTKPGNNNCNRPLADDSFYKALSAFDPNDVKGKKCGITSDYVSVYDSVAENSTSVYYDARMQKIVNEDEWEKYCYEYTVLQKRERKRALEKQGLLDAYNSLKTYLHSHNSIRTINCDPTEDWRAPYKIIKRNLSYGYKLTGFEILEDAIIWEITTYERPIKQNDCIRGIDICHLMYRNERTVEAANRNDYEMLCKYNEISKNKTSNGKYIDISDI